MLKNYSCKGSPCGYPSGQAQDLPLQVSIAIMAT